MKLINHNYNSLEECLKAMIDGGSFYCDDYDLGFCQKSGQYYAVLMVSKPDMLAGEEVDFRRFLERWKDWQIEYKRDWRDYVSDKRYILCRFNTNWIPVDVIAVSEDKRKVMYNDNGDGLWIDHDLVTPVLKTDASIWSPDDE